MQGRHCVHCAAASVVWMSAPGALGGATSNAPQCVIPATPGDIPARAEPIRLRCAAARVRTLPAAGVGGHQGANRAIRSAPGLAGSAFFVLGPASRRTHDRRQWAGSFQAVAVELGARNAAARPTLSRPMRIQRWVMPRGDKSKYTDRQARKADHIARGYEHRGVASDEAERRAWATVNTDDGGGKASGSGRRSHPQNRGRR
jgi:hypothetical protein